MGGARKSANIKRIAATANVRPDPVLRLKFKLRER